MWFDPGSLYALAALIAVTGIVTRVLLGSARRPGARVEERLSDMEGRVARAEAAASSVVGDLHTLREHQRFLTRVLETRLSRDAPVGSRPAASSAAAAQPQPQPPDTSPYIVQTVPAARIRPSPRPTR